MSRPSPGALQTLRQRAPEIVSPSVSYDIDLGVLTVDGDAVHAVRLLVKVLAPGDNEVCATPDVTNSGFRVCR